MDYKNFIELSLAHGVNFSIRKAISDGFSILGKNVGLYVGFTIVMFFISIASAFIGFIPVIGSLIISVLISPALMMGFATFARKHEATGDTAFENFFDPFKTNYSQLILVNLILQIIQMVLTMAFFAPIFVDVIPLAQDLMGAFSDPDTVQEIIEEIFTVALQSVIENWWMLAIFFIAMIVIQTLYYLANYFVIFYGFGFWEAMEASRYFMAKVFFKAIILWIIVGFITIIGSLITFYVGLLFFIPFTMLTGYSMFTQMAGFGDEKIELEDDLSI